MVLNVDDNKRAGVDICRPALESIFAQPDLVFIGTADFARTGFGQHVNLIAPCRTDLHGANKAAHHPRLGFCHLPHTLAPLPKREGRVFQHLLCRVDWQITVYHTHVPYFWNQK